MDKRPLKVFLCHAHADRDPVRALYSRLTTPALAGGAREDGVDRYAWLDKEKPCGERSAALSLSKRRTILPGQGFDRLNLPDWELEIRKAVRKIIDV
jgi:hypothetical protein